MKEFFGKLKAKLMGGGVWILFIVIVAVVIVPYIAILFMLRKQGKTLTITPTLAIVSIETSDKVDMKLAEDAVSAGKELLDKLNKIKG